MVEEWIVEEKVTNKFLDESGHHIRINGELDTAFNITAEGEDYGEDYVEQNKKLFTRLFNLPKQVPFIFYVYGR